MLNEPLENRKEPSEARLRANRMNAQRSCGPRDTSNTRFNALKNRLTPKTWPGLDTPEKREFVRRSFARLAPRSVLEAIRVVNLLETRSEEARFLTIERTVLTRKPVLTAAADSCEYPFVHDPTALKTLEQLTRHWTALTRMGEKRFVSLLEARAQTNAKGGPAGVMADQTEPAVPPDLAVVEPGTLDACLAQGAILILDGEDAHDYQELVRGLWEDLKPATTLEGFVVSDFSQTQWRLQRVPRIREILMASAAISASNETLGPGFAFIHDSQRNQGLETLREYEASLSRRLDGRLTLLKKIRKARWQDGPLGTNVHPQPNPTSMRDESSINNTTTNSMKGE